MKTVCLVKDCNKKLFAKGICTMHYRRLRVHRTLEIGRPNERHNKSFDTEYSTWHGMIQRCTNSKATGYENYGGRGITVCDRWLKSFANFYEDMGDKPKNHTIDRINNNLGYFPENCRWATRSDQTRNTRLRRDNTSGYKGVVNHRTGVKCWQAKVWIEGIVKSVGYFPTAEEAHLAREEYLSRVNKQIVKEK